MDRTDRKLDKRSINTNGRKAQSGDEKPGKQRMAGRQIKNVKARRKRGGKGEKQDESGRDDDMSEEGIRPKMKRDVLKKENKRRRRDRKGRHRKTDERKKIKGKNCTYKLYYFLVGAESNGKEELSGKKME